LDFRLWQILLTYPDREQKQIFIQKSISIMSRIVRRWSLKINYFQADGILAKNGIL